MKELKLKTLWTLDVEINGQMIQVFSSKCQLECNIEAKKYKPKQKTTIQRREVITDKY
jgi:hypothetical protein